MAPSMVSCSAVVLLLIMVTVDAGTWLSFNAGPGMAGVNDMDLSGLSGLKLARHTRNIARVVDVCAEQNRRMEKRAAAGLESNEDRTTRQFCDYLISVHGPQH